MLKKDESYLCCLPSYEAYMILGMIEKRMVARGGQFLAANTLSWADLHFMQVHTYFYLPISILYMSTKVRTDLHFEQVYNSSCLPPV